MGPLYFNSHTIHKAIHLSFAQLSVRPLHIHITVHSFIFVLTFGKVSGNPKMIIGMTIIDITYPRDTSTFRTRNRYQSTRSFSGMSVWLVWSLSLQCLGVVSND